MIFGAIESSLITYLVESAPIIFILGLVLLAVYRDNKELIKLSNVNNKDTIDHLRQQDKDNVETLNDISRLLSFFIEEARSNSVTTTSTIREEADKTRQHIDTRIIQIKDRIHDK